MEVVDVDEVAAASYLVSPISLLFVIVSVRGRLCLLHIQGGIFYAFALTIFHAPLLLWRLLLRLVPWLLLARAHGSVRDDLNDVQGDRHEEDHSPSPDGLL